MNLLQIKAFIPGKGEINLLDSPPLPEAKKILDEGDDEFGNKAFQLGAAILFPYMNRIRGRLLPMAKPFPPILPVRPFPFRRTGTAGNPERKWSPCTA